MARSVEVTSKDLLTLRRSYMLCRRTSARLCFNVELSRTKPKAGAYELYCVARKPVLEVARNNEAIAMLEKSVASIQDMLRLVGARLPYRMTAISAAGR